MANQLFNRQDLKSSAYLLTLACRASREHSALAERALNDYGDHGSPISGIVRDHFPEDTRITLRALARDVARYSDEAYAARPKGVRYATMRELGVAIATRDGSGFYGPRGTKA